MSLDEILADPNLPKVSIRMDGEPEKISSGQFNYLLGLSRDYLPDGHSKSYSQVDVMFDVLRDWYAFNRLARPLPKVEDFRRLTKGHAANLINWLLEQLGREPKFVTQKKGCT